MKNKIIYINKKNREFYFENGQNKLSPFYISEEYFLNINKLTFQVESGIIIIYVDGIKIIKHFTEASKVLKRFLRIKGIL